MGLFPQAIFSELCQMLDPGKPSFTPKKGKTSVVMFVGLQGICRSQMMVGDYFFVIISKCLSKNFLFWAAKLVPSETLITLPPI